MAYSSERQHYAARPIDPTNAIIPDIRSLKFSGVAGIEGIGIKDWLPSVLSLLNGDKNGGRGMIGRSNLTADVPKIQENAVSGKKRMMMKPMSLKTTKSRIRFNERL